LQTDAEARVRAEQGPLFKPKTPEYEYEIGSRHRKAESQALSKIVQKREETASIPAYDEAGQQVCTLFILSTQAAHVHQLWHIAAVSAMT
jgi:hypothetical protein